ncbi:hypothetical protein [Zavarzinella formosa]|uniref:hypothetical protein n=1 Tax=Zavarzinella formosa TaxID=360055 RepID=UPI00138AB5E8|nr:hypothetical protein [Zavarzinella formosa]
MTRFPHGADMTIDGVSQATGIAWLADIDAGADGLKLTIRDRTSEAMNATVPVPVPADDSMAILTEQPKCPQAVTGNLVVEASRNEVRFTLGELNAAVRLGDIGGAFSGDKA